MKNIKFRAITNGDFPRRFVYGDLIHSYCECAIKCGHLISRVNEDTIGQFIGLIDKNKKDIYVGDILEDKLAKHKFRVYSVKGGFAINTISFPELDRDYPFPLQPLCDEQTVGYIEGNCEIIGNVYENSDLLNK